jgi:capsular polysaccharide export protein
MGAGNREISVSDRVSGGHTKKRILRFDPRANAVLPGKSSRERVILLQGPVGPFFKHLQTSLEEHGYDVWRICFNAGDRFFSNKNGRINFYGSSGDWKNWFSDFVVAAEVDRIILFGAERDIHRSARTVAAEAGIELTALEEGYIRPGYITVEQDGNNALSPLAGNLPPDALKYYEQAEFSAENFKGFRSMCIYGAVYYAIATFFSYGKQRQLMHRRFAAGPELFYWMRNGWRRLLRQNRNFVKIEHLLEHHDANYYLVPLQVAADTQMQDAALGWNLLRLVSSTLKSFAQHAPAESRLVFKVHPLERGHCGSQPLIFQTARAFGVEDRVDIIDTGSLGLLARHAAGMITINSTSGLSAIFHGIPLLVVGNAFYAHPDLVICGRGEPDFDAFWTSRHVAAPSLRQAYLNWVRHEALMEGDFYAEKGIQAAFQSILTRLQDVASAKMEPIKKRSAC